MKFNPFLQYLSSLMVKCTSVKWIASDITHGLITGLASEYNEKIYLTLRFPAVLPEGVFKMDYAHAAPKEMIKRGRIYQDKYTEGEQYN